MTDFLGKSRQYIVGVCVILHMMLLYFLRGGSSAYSSGQFALMDSTIILKIVLLIFVAIPHSSSEVLLEAVHSHTAMCGPTCEIFIANILSELLRSSKSFNIALNEMEHAPQAY